MDYDETSMNVRVVVRISPVHETEESCQSLFIDAAASSSKGSEGAQRSIVSPFGRTRNADTSFSSSVTSEASRDAADAPNYSPALANSVLNQRYTSKLKPPRKAFFGEEHKRTRQKLPNTIMYDTCGAVVNYHIVQETPFKATASGDEDDDFIKSGRGPSKSILRKFRFDAMLSPSCTQEDVYNCAVGDTVSRVCRGFHTTILAYGQAGSGKTYTMEGGSSLQKNDNHVTMRTLFPEELTKDDGISCRAVHDLFAGTTDLVNSGFDVQVKLSCLEIHHDELKDLLVKDCQSLYFRDQGGFVQVLGLQEITVSSIQQVRALMEMAAARRTTSITRLNECSSRSHAITTLTVTVTAKKTDSERRSTIVGKLTLVDLAGSERIKDNEKVGVFQQETIKINKDLFVLGKVISALSKREKRGSNSNTHIPYRDSILTRLLRDSLGANCCTIFVACVSGSRTHIKQTINTLRFAERARAIKNTAEPNLIENDAAKTTAKRLSKRHKERKQGLLGRTDGRCNGSRYVTRVSGLIKRKNALRSSSLPIHPREEYAETFGQKSFRRQILPEQSNQRSGKARPRSSTDRLVYRSRKSGSNRVLFSRRLDESSVRRTSPVACCRTSSKQKRSGSKRSAVHDFCPQTDQSDDGKDSYQMSSMISENDEYNNDGNDSLPTDHDSFDEFLSDLLLQCESDQDDAEIRRVEAADSNFSCHNGSRNSSSSPCEDILDSDAKRSVLAFSSSTQNSSHRFRACDEDDRILWTTSEGSASDEEVADEVSSSSTRSGHEEEGIRSTSTKSSERGEFFSRPKLSKCKSYDDDCNNSHFSFATIRSYEAHLNCFHGGIVNDFRQACSPSKHNCHGDDITHFNLNESYFSDSNYVSTTFDGVPFSISYDSSRKSETMKLTDVSQTTAKTECESTENDSRDEDMLSNLPSQAESKSFDADNEFKIHRCASQSTCSSLADDTVLSDLYDVVEIQPTPVDEYFPACKCEISIFSGKKQHVEFYLPRVSIFCACGKHQSVIQVNDDPFALENILRPWQVAFMKSHGIHDATKLRLVAGNNSRNLAKKMRNWRKRQGLAPMGKMPCIIALHIWARTCRSVIRWVEEQVAQGIENPGRPHFLDIDITSLSVGDNVTTVVSKSVRE